MVADIPNRLRQKCSPKHLVFSDISLTMIWYTRYIKDRSKGIRCVSQLTHYIREQCQVLQRGLPARWRTTSIDREHPATPISHRSLSRHVQTTRSQPQLRRPYKARTSVWHRQTLGIISINNKYNILGNINT